jgi:hypothetical protein
MAITTTNSNHYKYQLATGNIDFENDTFKMILMDTSFTFDKDTHATLASVTANQIATGNGYTQNNITLANVSISEDDVNDRFYATWDNVTVTASGGAIEDFTGVIIYDDTTSDDTVIFYTDLDTTISLTDGLSFIANSIEVEIA